DKGKAHPHPWPGDRVVARSGGVRSGGNAERWGRVPPAVSAQGRDPFRGSGSPGGGRCERRRQPPHQLPRAPALPVSRAQPACHRATAALAQPANLSRDLRAGRSSPFGSAVCFREATERRGQALRWDDGRRKLVRVRVPLERLGEGLVQGLPDRQGRERGELRRRLEPERKLHRNEQHLVQQLREHGHGMVRGVASLVLPRPELRLPGLVHQRSFPRPQVHRLQWRSRGGRLLQAGQVRRLSQRRHQGEPEQQHRAQLQEHPDRLLRAVPAL
ncbi:MAG: hypothetical protein AVDCRST_MAG17-1771, partial [uncultured Solirubrobacterales bacterium]